MILVALLVVPLLGGVIAWAAQRVSTAASRGVALSATGFYLVLAAAALLGRGATTAVGSTGGWPASFVEVRAAWIPSLGVSFHLAADGLSTVLVVLTGVLGIVAVAASWSEVSERIGFFYFQLLLVLAGVTGVFLAADLFLLYLFWELMLVPMYFLVALWGHESRRRAALEFFLFTQAGGLLLLIGIATLYVRNGLATGTFTFEYAALLGSHATAAAPVWLVAAFVAAFAVKLPAFPFHPWLPDAHTQAPTAGSIVLAGLLLKTGAYGFLRFVVPLFPQQASWLAPYLLWAGVVGVLYGSFLSFAQRDLKRLVAYTSVGHMGYVLVGIFSGTSLGSTGAVLEMVCHGLSTGALFFVVGSIMRRSGTRDMGRIEGLTAALPKMSALTLVFVLASVGLPGLGNFVAEFLVTAGAFQVSPAVAVLAAVGMIPSIIYGVWFVYRVFQGPSPQAGSEEASELRDLRPGELAVLGVLSAALLWIGLFPQPVINAYRQGLPPSVNASASAAGQVVRR